MKTDKRKKQHRKKSNGVIAKFAITQCIIGFFVFCIVVYTMATGNHFHSKINILEYKSQSQIKMESIQSNRGYVYDRNKEIIAQDIDTYTIYAVLHEGRMGIGNVPAYVVDPWESATLLAPILETTPEILYEYLTLDVYQTYFGYYGKKLSSTQRDEILAMKLPGIEFDRNIDRIYPTGQFSSHLIGFAQYEEDQQRIVGKMGIEYLYDEVLQGQNGMKRSIKDANNISLPGTSSYEKLPIDGNDVYLTLDKNVQVALESTLQQTIDNLGAIKAWGVVMEVETGKILGWASSPSFDLNIREIENYINYPSEFVFEPGSVMKPLTYAAAIDYGSYNPEQLVQTGAFHVGLDQNGSIVRLPTSSGSIGTINDALRKGWGMISYDDGMIRSSNTVIAQLLTDFLPLDVFGEYLDRFQLFDKLDILGITTAEGTKNFQWPFDKLATGFGQASSLTTINLMQAFTAIFNEGKMMKPYFIEKVVDSNGNVIESYEPELVGQPIKASTANQVLALMQRVVDEPYGTAKIYGLNDTTVAAKTGTAELATNGRYEGHYISSVMAAAPADDPKVMMYYAFENTDFNRLNGEYFRQTLMEALLALNIAGDKFQESVEKDNMIDYCTFELLNYRNHSLAYAKNSLSSCRKEPIVLGDGTTIVGQYPRAYEKISNEQNVLLLTDSTSIKMPNMVGWTKKEVTAFWQLTGIPVAMDGLGVVMEQNIAQGELLSRDVEIIVKLEY